MAERIPGIAVNTPGQGIRYQDVFTRNDKGVRNMHFPECSDLIIHGDAERSFMHPRIRFMHGPENEGTVFKHDTVIAPEFQPRHMRRKPDDRR